MQHLFRKSSGIHSVSPKTKTFILHNKMIYIKKKYLIINLCHWLGSVAHFLKSMWMCEIKLEHKLQTLEFDGKF